MFGRLTPSPARVLGCSVLALVFAFVMISAQELSFIWLILMIMGLSFVVACFLSGAPGRLLFVCYCAAVSIEITKGIIAEGAVYTPGLYLSLSDLFLFPLLAICAFEKVFKQVPGRGSGPIMVAAVVWLLSQWISAFLSPVGLGSLLGAVNQTKYFLVLWLFSSVLRRPQAWRDLMLGISLGVGAHFLMSTLQVLSGGAIALQGIKTSTQQTISYAGSGLLNLIRPSGMLSHPNSLADFLVLFMPGAMLLVLLKAPLGRARFHIGAVLAACMLMLILTLSRGGWLALAVGLMVLVPMAYQRKLIGDKEIKRFIGIAILGVFIIAIAFPAVVLRLTESDNKSTSSRFMLAEQALLIIERNPVVGVGLGSYARAAHHNIPASFSAIEPGFRDIILSSLVHNKFLLVAAESGLVGLSLFLCLFFVTFKQLWKADFEKDPVRQALAIGLAAGLAATLVTFMFEHAYMGVPIETVWATIGAAIALTHGQPQRKVAKPSRRGAFSGAPC